MSSSAENKPCANCLRSMQGQAIFIAECSHSFHLGCTPSYATYGNYYCPVCYTKRNNVPFTSPNIYTSTYRFEAEPIHYSDDEPLPAQKTDGSISNTLQKVVIKAIPERPAVAASESIFQFLVLVGLKAPPLLNDRAPIDLVTVLDVSGSMYGPKLDLLKHAVNFVIDNLGPGDRLSIVSFSTNAQRILPLRKMTDTGRVSAKQAIDSLSANGSTNIAEALRKGVRVLQERKHKNPVATIIFLSDGNDTSSSYFPNLLSPISAQGYLHLLPFSIPAGNKKNFPIHAFGFGSDHDPLAMHAISDATGGTISFIESYKMVQDAFASCIGGLLSVVSQELFLTLKSASYGVEIKSIPSGRYTSEISYGGSRGLIDVGDLYADEVKDFLINLSVPAFHFNEVEENERKTTLLDIVCSYKDVVSKNIVKIESELVEILRPNSVSPQDMMLSFEVDRQRNRLYAAQSIEEAQKMAETGNLIGARDLLSNRRMTILASASGKAGDELRRWLEAEMKEVEQRMATLTIYQQSGRAYALSGMSSHSNQRATTRGDSVSGAQIQQLQQQQKVGAGSTNLQSTAAPFSGVYATPNMAKMVSKSQQLNKTESTTKK